VVLGISGALRAGFELTAFSQLWTTSYGQAILVKTGLVLAALGIGLLMRAHVQRRAFLEIAFVVAVVGVAAVLVQLRPGRNYIATAALQPAAAPPPPPRDAVVLAQEVGSLAV